MAHSVAELYAETITAPSPSQLRGRCYYIDPADEHSDLDRTLRAIDAKWMARLDDLRAGGWRRVRRVLVDREYRRQPVKVTIPVWLAIIISVFGFSGGR